MHIAIAISFGLAAAVPAALVAQIPDTYTNLQVLPEDITRNRLVGTMRGFALGLGVRCSYCHGEGQGAPGAFEGVDFASDSLETKRKAREMLRMVQAINRDFIPKAVTSGAALQVQCVTCHRGVSRPEPLEGVIARAVRTHGVPAAIEEYRALREEYYGSGSYDFGEQTLISAAGAVNSPGTRQQALDLLQLNLELHPRSANTHATIGQIHGAMGDTAAALTAFRRALEFRPGDRFLTEQIQRLGGG